MRFNFLILIVLLFQFSLLKADDLRRDTLIVEDLSDDFLMYSSEFGTFVPVNKPAGAMVNLYTDLSKYKDYMLSFKAAAGTSLLVDYKLVYQNTGKTEKEILLQVGKIQNRKGKHLLTFYNERGKLPIHVAIAHVGDPYRNIGNIFYSVRLSRGGEVEFYLFLVILTLFTIIKNRYPKRLSESLRFFGSGGIEDVGALSDLFSSSSLAIILFNSLAFTYLYSIISFPGKINTPSVFNLTIVSILIFISFYIKYFMVKLVGGIFNIQNVARLHFIEIVKFALLFNLIMVPLLTIFSFSETISQAFPVPVFIIILLTGLILVLFKLLLLTFRVPDFKYIYLFSYLCIGELIPLGFILKITLL